VPLSSAEWQLGLLRAQLAQAKGDWAGAYRALVQHFEARGFPERRIRWPNFARYVAQASVAAQGGGDPAAAESLARHSLRLAREDGQDAERSAVIGQALLALSRARLARGDLLTARQSLERALGPLLNGYGPEHERTRAARALLDSLPAPDDSPSDALADPQAPPD
jgi:hypothetical protein